MTSLQTVELVAVDSDGSSSLRYARSGDVTVTSSNPNIVSVPNPLQWVLLSPGTAQVVLAWSGLRVTNQVSVPGSSSTQYFRLRR